MRFVVFVGSRILVCNNISKIVKVARIASRQRRFLLSRIGQNQVGVANQE